MPCITRASRMWNAANSRGFVVPFLVVFGWKKNKAAICQSLLEILHLLWDWDCIASLELWCVGWISNSFSTSFEIVSGAMALQEKVVLWGQEEWRKQWEKNEFVFYYADFCMEHDSESEVGLQQCYRKVFEGRSSARQFPSLATLMYYTSKIFDRWAHIIALYPWCAVSWAAEWKIKLRLLVKNCTSPMHS